MRRSFVTFLCLPALLGACATSGTTSGTTAGTSEGTSASAATASPKPSTSPHLTQDEITAANLPTAYELVDRLRRSWLRRDARTGSAVAVFMDNQSIGDAEKLRDIPAQEVTELHYLPNDEAVKRWGGQVKGSVIVVVRRR